jgi:hypothetical protein
VPDAVHIAGKRDVDGVLPHVDGHRHDIAVPCEGSRRKIGRDVEQAVEPANSLAVKSTSSWYDSSSLISNFLATAEPPAALISSATACAAASLKSAAVTLMPSWARRNAVAPPMFPGAAPATIATLS